MPLIVSLASLPANAATQSYPKQKSEEEWAQQLTEQQLFVLRKGGTEPPNSSPLVRERREGGYCCSACGSRLFSSAAKIEARTGWPSFGDALKGSVDVAEAGFFEAVAGSECRCATCGGRIGERFSDGTSFPGTVAMKTGKRFSINGAALVFRPAAGGEPVKGDNPAPSTQRLQYEWKMRDGGLRSI